MTLYLVLIFNIYVKSFQSVWKMSLMGKLKLFFGIQMKQCLDGVYIHQTKYTKEHLKKFNIEDCKPIQTRNIQLVLLSQKVHRGIIG